MAQNSEAKERYTFGYTEHSSGAMSTRTADRNAAFFLRYLTPGMSVLDCGCGPGSITLGLAEVVAPGDVIGIDIGESEVTRARTSASEHGIENVTFEVGNIYSLSYPDDSFDAVFSSAVLEHISEPREALAEMRRVLKPGGLIGVRDADWGGVVFSPSSQLVQELLEMREETWRRNGGDSRLGRQLGALLREAGFEHVRPTAIYTTMGNFENATVLPSGNLGEFMARWLSDTPLGNQMMEFGIADQKRQEEYMAACREWGQHPDAYMAYSGFEAVGWKGSD